MWPTSVSSSTFPKWPTPVFFGVSHDDSPPEPCAPVAKIGSEKIPAYAMGTANELVVDETFQRWISTNNFKHPLKKTHWLRFFGKMDLPFFCSKPYLFWGEVFLDIHEIQILKGVDNSHAVQAWEISVSLLYLNRISWCLPQQVASPLIRFPAYLIDSYCVKIYAMIQCINDMNCVLMLQFQCKVPRIVMALLPTDLWQETTDWVLVIHDHSNAVCKGCKELNICCGT